MVSASWAASHFSRKVNIVDLIGLCNMDPAPQLKYGAEEIADAFKAFAAEHANDNDDGDELERGSGGRRCPASIPSCFVARSSQPESAATMIASATRRFRLRVSSKT